MYLNMTPYCRQQHGGYQGISFYCKVHELWTYHTADGDDNGNNSSRDMLESEQSEGVMGCTKEGVFSNDNVWMWTRTLL